MTETDETWRPMATSLWQSMAKPGRKSLRVASLPSGMLRDRASHPLGGSPAGQGVRNPPPYNEPMASGELTHLDDQGRARMVDVGGKPSTERWARARAVVSFSSETLARVRAGDLPKGDVRAVAELAGIMAAKRTPELIPLCHPLMLSQVDVLFELKEDPPSAVLTSTVRTTGPTGVEMEALTAAAVAALTVYDMVKGVERGARISEVRLLEKHGGRSGDVVLAE